MKFSKIAVGLIIFILCGLTIFSLHVLRDEAAQDTKDLIAKGNQLVSLIPLYPLKQFKGAEGHFFLRTLTEYDANKNIAYLYIHDGDGRIVTSLAGAEISALIPEGVKLLSLNTIRLIRQPVNPAGGGEKIYEFAKPIFEAGEKVGVVRLGLKLPQTVYASMERFSMLALVAFFIISAMLLSYYGVMLALKPLRNISQNIQDACSGIDLNPKGVSRTSQIAPIVNELQGSLGTITERLNHIEQDNLNLASKLGVATFEKKQILKILDSINFGVIITDLQDNISHINEYMLKLLKKSPAEVLDHPFTEVVEHEDLQAFVSRYDALERSGSAVFIDTTFPELAPNEIYRVTSSYLLDDEKTPIGKMMTFSNITSEKLAENAKQDFIAHVAHELMTPLTNIRSYSEMLMDGEVEDLDMQKEFYNTINEQTTRLAGLIKNLLNLSKMEMGSLSIERGWLKPTGLWKIVFLPWRHQPKVKTSPSKRKCPISFRPSWLIRIY